MELTAQTRIKLSQIRDLLTWRTVEDRHKKTRSFWNSDKKWHVLGPDGKWHIDENQNKEKNKHKDARQRKFEQTHKQTKKGNRTPEDNTPRPIKEKLPVTKNFTLKKGVILPENQEIRNRVSIARGAGIDCIDRLVNDYGRPNIQSWSKEKGRALIAAKEKLFEVNIHFYSYEGKELYEPKIKED